MIRALVVCIAMVAGASQPGAPGASPSREPDRTSGTVDPAFEERLKEIDGRMGMIRDLRARFEQRRHTPLLKAPMLSSGRIVLKSDRVRWDTLLPRKSVMTIDRERVQIYDPEAAVVEVYEVDGSLGEYSGSPLPRLSEMRKRFDLAPMAPRELGAPEGDARYVGVELLPVSEEMREHVSRVRVVLDSSVPCVSVIEIVDADDERTEIRFTDVRTNTGVRDAEVALGIPPGTRVSRPLGGGAPAK